MTNAKMAVMAYRTLIGIGAIQYLFSDTIRGQVLNELGKQPFIDRFLEDGDSVAFFIKTLCLTRSYGTRDPAVLKVLHQIGSGPAVGKV